MRCRKTVFAVVLALLAAFSSVSLHKLSKVSFSSQISFGSQVVAQTLDSSPANVLQPPLTPEADIQANMQAEQTFLCWAIAEALSPVAASENGSTVVIASSASSIDCQQPVGTSSPDAAMMHYQEGGVYLKQLQYEQAIDSYQQALDTARQTVLDLSNDSTRNSSNSSSRNSRNNSARNSTVDRDAIESALYKLGFADFKLAQFSSQLGYSSQQQRALTAAEEVLVKAAVGMNLFSLTSDGQISIRGDSDYLPQTRTFKLLQQVYIAQSKYEQALLIAEKGRTIAVDENIVNNVWGNGSDVPHNRRLAIAEELVKFSNLTIDDVQRAARDENATIISYSVISDEDDPRPFLTRDSISAPIDQSISSSQKLLIWVIQPTGKITFNEQSLDQLFTADDLVEPGSTEFCEAQDRGQESAAITRVVRWTRGCLLGIPQREVAAITATSQANIATVNQRLKQLYQILIPPEVDALLPQDPEAHIIFVPQGALFFVPFAALQDASGQYLIRRHTILTAPNLRALLLPQPHRNPSLSDAASSPGNSAAVGQAPPSSAPPSSAPPSPVPSSSVPPSPVPSSPLDPAVAPSPVVPSNGTVLIVGNPAMPAIHSGDGDSTQRGAVSEVFPPLEKAGEEAQAIATLFQQHPYLVDTFINQAAPEDTVVQLMPQSRIIHLATHGILEAALETPPTETLCSIRASVVANAGTSPEQVQNSLDAITHRLKAECEARIDRINAASVQTAAGAIALSSSITSFTAPATDTPATDTPADRSAVPSPAADGLLTAREILSMELNADLVVLSACNTGRGPLTAGGVIGLPFSFSLAGVPNIIVSLWAVSDDSTAELMKDFYQQLLSNPVGIPDKAKSLRQAMVNFLQAHPDAPPREWAAFTLMGRQTTTSLAG